MNPTWSTTWVQDSSLLSRTPNEADIVSPLAQIPSKPASSTMRADSPSCASMRKVSSGRVMSWRNRVVDRIMPCEYSKGLLAHQRLDFVTVRAEAQEDALVDHDRGHREPPGEAEDPALASGSRPTSRTSTAAPRDWKNASAASPSAFPSME